jgi:predicted nucleic acid-binding protein
MKIYLDNCCYNRPYDDQSHLAIRLETEAKIQIQEDIRSGKIKLAWSYILDYENSQNPMKERKKEISLWKELSAYFAEESQNILSLMNQFILFGIKPLDALHIACCLELECDYFITVDKGILRKRDMFGEKVKILSPIEMIYLLEDQ